MTKKNLISCILPALLWFCSPSPAAEFLHQTLQVTLNPQAETLQVSVELSLPAGHSTNFLLHRGLNPHSQTPGVRLEETDQVDGPVPLTAYRVVLPEGKRRFSLTYGGRISHAFSRLKESPGRSRERLAGTISNRGIHLDSVTGWYPIFPGSLQRFALEVDLPDGWMAVSQGEGPEIAKKGGRQRSGWQASQPQDEIYLIAAPFQYYRQQVGDIEAQVFLRQADEALASRYLAATERYLKLYQRLIGPYPYAKFALVENFWETGYGMPSFTLLGPQVIRLPFIPYTSYPHEILHNWWGNSVYVDYADGNWSEGMTSYLADHLLAEQRGSGSNHRRSALQRYADFVRLENDFPLRKFQGRHSAASQAVGYDKSLMMFHMLRRKLGDDHFIDGVRRIYRDNRFQKVGFPQLQAAFEAAGETSLGDFFRQWVERTGAPRLALEQVRVEVTPRGYRLSGALRQTQKASPFHLRVPLVVGFEDGAYQTEQVEMAQRQQAFHFDLTATPLSLSVDPWFDLFRALDPAETPPSLSQFFGAERVLILLPATAGETFLQEYRALATAWAEDFPKAEIRLDRELDRLPEDRPVLLLGWENRFAPGFLEALSNYPFNREADGLSLWGESFDEVDHGFALARRPKGSTQTRLWIATRRPESLAGLARKLPHYGKYSALAFSGNAPENRLKRQWPVIGSPLRVTFAKGTSTPLPEPPPLTAELDRL